MLYGAPTPRRRDAQRNRTAIVRAASELLMTGAAVLMPEIARRAGVGQATLYRHFRDRPALVTAVVADQLERLDAYLAAHRDAPFRPLLAEVLRTQVALRPLVRLVGGLDRSAQRRVVSTLSAPLRRARANGEIRPDFAPDDLVLLFTMLAAVPDAAERSISLLLDGVFGGPGERESSNVRVRSGTQPAR